MARTVYNFTGSNGLGPVSVSGLKIGDEVLHAFVTSGSYAYLDNISWFEPFCTSDGTLYQSVGLDLSSKTVCILVERKATY